MDSDLLTDVHALLAGSKRGHHQCDDSYYSCPKSPDGPWDADYDTDCDCGADEWNTQVEALLSRWPTQQLKP